MSYTTERDQFVARMSAEGMPLWAVRSLLRQATTLQRLAELACSSEAADRDRIRCPRVTGEKIAARSKIATAIKAFERYPCLCDNYQDGKHELIPRIKLQDWQAEQRAIKVVEEVNRDLAWRPSGMVAEGVAKWRIVTEGDPRGYVLRVIPPSYAERNKDRDRLNLDAIGVPARDSGLRF